MGTSAARKASSTETAPDSRTRRASREEPIVVYMATSLDGTTFALEPSSQRRIREAFPEVRVSTRHIFIAHDTREALEKSLGHREEQIAALLTGVSAERLTERFRFVSFRDPTSEQEVLRLPPGRAARRA